MVYRLIHDWVAWSPPTAHSWKGKLTMALVIARNARGKIGPWALHTPRCGLRSSHQDAWSCPRPCLVLPGQLHMTLVQRHSKIFVDIQRHIGNKTRWKPRTRMYSRSWTTNANLCNRKTNLFLHASCPHTVSAKAPEQQFTKRQLTSTTTSPSAQRNHNQHNNITSAMKPQRNHPHNEITNATKSQAQQHHQRNEITSTTNAQAEWNHQRTAPAQQNHQSKRHH